MQVPLDDWFAREILVHEASLMRYLARAWRRKADLLDIRQETYIRVYEAARKALPLSARSFLFVTARNLVIDRARRARIESIDSSADLEVVDAPLDELSPERRITGREDLQRVSRALDRLPPRCRDVLWMRKVDGLSQREVAAQLGISEGTVEKHIAKGMRCLAESLFGSPARAVRASAKAEFEPGPEYVQQPAD